MQLLIVEIFLAGGGLCIIWRGYQIRYKLKFELISWIEMRQFTDKVSWARLAGLAQMVVGFGCVALAGVIALFPSQTHNVTTIAMVALLVGLFIVIHRLKKYEKT